MDLLESRVNKFGDQFDLVIKLVEETNLSVQRSHECLDEMRTELRQHRDLTAKNLAAMNLIQANRHDENRTTLEHQNAVLAELKMDLSGVLTTVKAARWTKLKAISLAVGTHRAVKWVIPFITVVGGIVAIKQVGGWSALFKILTQ